MSKKTKKSAKIVKEKPRTYTWTVLLSGYNKIQIEQAIFQIENSLIDRSYMTMCASESILRSVEVDYNSWEENTSDNGYTLFLRTKVGKSKIKEAKTIAHSFIAGWCAAKNSL